MYVCGLQAQVAEDPAVAAARAMSPEVCVAALPCSCDVVCACTVLVFVVCLLFMELPAARVRAPLSFGRLFVYACECVKYCFRGLSLRHHSAALLRMSE